MQDETASRESIAQKLLNHLKDGNTITALEALKRFGCMRLSARIYNLRNMGHIIESKYEKSEQTGKAYSRYKLIKDAQGKVYPSMFQPEQN